MMEFNILKLVGKQKTIILYREFPSSRARMSSNARPARKMRNGCGLKTRPERRNYYKI